MKQVKEIGDSTFYQDSYAEMELLRFTTAGSVDDGKSTLIGRLLYDSQAILNDQLEEVERVSSQKGEKQLNLAFFTDGLRAEREQGITIDVAYRFFHTLKRKFIIADSPGHFEFTRNMVTGASTANAVIILVDAKRKIVEQTVRHAYIASLLCIPHVIVCVNKMDLVGYSSAVFQEIQTEFSKFASYLNLRDVRFIPISALHGDNVVERSQHTPWYNGPTLMYLLENMFLGNDYNQVDPRFPVQHVITSHTGEFNDYQAYAGRVVSGTFRVGDRVKVLPEGVSTTIKGIRFHQEELPYASVLQSVSIILDHKLSMGRGSMIVPLENGVQVSQNIDVMVCWLSETPLDQHTQYALKHTTNDVQCVVKGIKYKVNMQTLEKDFSDKKVEMNDMVCLSLTTTKPLVFDSYGKNRITGSLILIDEKTNITVGGGMIM